MVGLLRVHIIINLLFLMFLSAINGQVVYSHYATEDILAVSASNYTPSLNEIVKIKLKFKSPYDYKEGDYHLFIYTEQDGIEKINGEQDYKKDLKKGDVVEIEAEVKFTKTKIYEVYAGLNKEISAIISFYVNGAFRESREVEVIKDKIERIKKYIEEQSKSEEIIEPPGNSILSSWNEVKNQQIELYNEYDKKNEKVFQKKNEVLYKEFKIELDSLNEIAHKLHINKQKLKFNKRSLSDTLNNKSRPVWEKEVN